MLNLFKKLMNAVNFVHLPKEEKKIVVYSEGKNYWTIFDEIIYSLTKENNFKVCYLTSDENDPGIKFSSKNFSSFLIDEGYIRNWLFSKIDADIVIKSLGFDPENIPKLFNAEELSVSKWGTIKINLQTMETNVDGVFAAGDIVRGASLVVWAIKDGRDAADQIANYIKSKNSKEKAA